MMPCPLAVVVTTIQPPTKSMRDLSAHLKPFGAPLIVIGDKKGPTSFETEGAEFYSLDDQLALSLSLAGKLPTGHYARKNIGYLLAMRRAASCIYETDDDNAPLANWAPRSESVVAQQTTAGGWFNVYRQFTDELIWPRGFPLDQVTKQKTFQLDSTSPLGPVFAPIQQGLANGSPDVDAVWRLILDRDIRFASRVSLSLPPNTWCPFNSQSTWWWPSAFPLMYLPSYCSFRMTDIWRSFIAQRCLWAMDSTLVFHAPEVHQERNEHNLMHDFEDEIPGYRENDRIADLLIGLSLRHGSAHTGQNLRACYQALVAADIFPEKELDLVTAWLADFSLVNS